jgi:hypothetical protein
MAAILGGSGACEEAAAAFCPVRRAMVAGVAGASPKEWTSDEACHF